VTLTKGVVCPSSTAPSCTSGIVNYRINPSGSLVLSGQSLYTSAVPEKFNITYTGTDDKGNSVRVQEIVSVSGSNWISP
jgi:hypothetical protein